ncbi:MAG: enoyl-CoA hydratase-related protein, partial [Burkholderiales bacterium]
KLDDEVEKLARTIIAKPSSAVATGKQIFYRQLEMQMEDAYRNASQSLADNVMTEDANEGIEAFLEKRPPRWRGA